MNKTNYANNSMQKPCTATYIIIGNKQDIKFLHSRLLKMLYGHKTRLKQLAKEFYPAWNHYEIAGYFFDLKLTNNRQITLTAVTEANPEPEIWFNIGRLYISVKCYYYAEETTSGMQRTNDACGRFFSIK